MRGDGLKEGLVNKPRGSSFCEEKGLEQGPQSYPWEEPELVRNMWAK